MTPRDEEDALRSVALQNADSIRIARQRAERQAEATLREQAALLDLTHDTILVRDMNDVITYWNRGAEELYGWTRQEAIGQVTHRLVRTVFPAPLVTINEQLLRTGRWEGELVHTKRDGTPVVVASRWSLQRDEDGSPRAILETNNDITERKRAEEARQEIEEQWRAAFESNPTMYFIVDANGTIVSVNPFGGEQLGYQPSELIGRPVLSVFYEPDRAFVQKNAEACLEQPGRIGRWEARKIRKDGTMLWVRETGNAVLLKNGPVLLVACEDVTERNRAQALLAGEKRLLELVARGESLPLVLTALCVMVEEQSPGVLASILLLEGDRLRHGAAPSLPKEYTDAIDGTVIGPEAGSCGTAAYRREQVIVSDIATDPLWANYREVALPHSLRACWSTPVFSSKGQVIATFALYYHQPRSPTAEDLGATSRFAQIASIAIERDRDEERLRRQADLLEQTHDAILVWPLGGSILYWNRGAERLYGFSRGEALGRTSHDLLRTEHPLPAEHFVELIERGGTWSGELAHWTRDGRRVVVDSRHVPVRTADGRTLVLETNRDITDRKRAEESLLRTEAYLTDAQRLSHTGSWGWDIPARRISYWSEEQFRLYGFDPQGSLPSLEAVLDRVHPSDRARSLERFEAALREKKGYDDQYRLRLPDGTVRYVHIVGRPMFDAAGEVAEYVGTTIDLTEHKRAAEALSEAQAQLAHVTRVTTLGEVTASLAHEVNQPLAAIVNNANACLGLLPERSDLDEVREALEDIVSDGERASAIIERVRRLAKRSPPDKAPLRLADVVDEVVALAAAESTTRGVAIFTAVGPDLPLVLGDRVQLQQVLLNLVVNGMDAMAGMTEGERRLEIRGRRDRQDGSPAVLISVEDHGTGLEQALVESVFEAFYTTKPHGMGMGLAISRSIVSAHGGCLWAERNEGPGATFSFRLPAAPP